MTNRGFLFGCMMASCLCLSACQQPIAIDISKGEPDHALDVWLAQDHAQILCKYSRGSFPSWHLWREYQHWLKPDEATAIAFVQQRLESRVPHKFRPKMRAVAKFIANNTQCTPDDSGVFKQTDNAGNIRFTFKQEIPAVPNVPPPNTHDLSPKAIEQAWMKAFQRHFEGQTHTRTIQITLEPAQEHATQYVMRSNIFESYAEPLQIMDFWKKLEAWKLDEALELLSIACVQNAKICHEMTSHFEAASEIQNQTASSFQQNVEWHLEKLTSVSLTGNSRYAAAQLILTNHSNISYANILLKTDEIEPQYCVLQSKRTWREDSPIRLEPGQTATAWCALEAETSPFMALDIVVADMKYSEP